MTDPENYDDALLLVFDELIQCERANLEVVEDMRRRALVFDAYRLPRLAEAARRAADAIRDYDREATRAVTDKVRDEMRRQA